MISGVHVEVVLAASYAVFLVAVRSSWSSWRAILISDPSATATPGLFISRKWICGNVPRVDSCCEPKRITSAASFTIVRLRTPATHAPSRITAPIPTTDAC
jgi:hypothetical protein